MSEWRKLPYERRAYVLQHLEDEANRLSWQARARDALDATYPEVWAREKSQMAQIARERAQAILAARQVLVLEGGKEIEDEATTSRPA